MELVIVIWHKQIIVWTSSEFQGEKYKKNQQNVEDSNVRANRH